MRLMGPPLDGRRLRKAQLYSKTQACQLEKAERTA